MARNITFYIRRFAAVLIIAFFINFQCFAGATNGKQSQAPNNTEQDLSLSEMNILDISYEEYLEGLDHDINMKRFDPYKRFNMSIMAVLFVLDITIFRGLANIYARLIPRSLRLGVGNFLRNTNELKTGVNDVLQGETKQAAKSVTRFLINTIFGCLGLFDVAAQAKVKHHSNDFGITLGVWGMSSGPYLVTHNGPSTFRDFFGFIVDGAINPFRYTAFCNFVRRGKFAYTMLKIVHKRYESLSSTSKLKGSKNPYALIKLAYMQPRVNKIAKKRFAILQAKARKQKLAMEKAKNGTKH